MQLMLIKIAAIIILAASLFVFHNWQVNTAVSKALVTQKAEYDKLTQSLQNKSAVFETSIKDSSVDIAKEKDAKIESITRKYNAAVDSLRKYSASTSTQSNITSDSSNAESTRGIITEGLFADHAAISLGIAKNAEELKQHLNACYQQYDVVKNQLDDYRK